MTSITRTMHNVLEICSILEDLPLEPAQVSHCVLEYLLEISISTELNKLNKILTIITPTDKIFNKMPTAEKIQALICFQQRLSSAETYRGDWFYVKKPSSIEIVTIIHNRAGAAVLSRRAEGADFYCFGDSHLIHLQLREQDPKRYCPLDITWSKKLYDVIEKNGEAELYDSRSKSTISDHVLIVSDTDIQLLELPTTFTEADQ